MEHGEHPIFDVESVTTLRRVISRLARQLNESATAEGLSPSQASTLGVVGARSPIGLAELAEVEGINPTMLSRIIGKLDEFGLIRRTPNPADQRAALVEITPRGRATRDRIMARRTLAVTMVLDELPQPTTAALLTALPSLEALADGLARSGRAVPEHSE